MTSARSMSARRVLGALALAAAAGGLPASSGREPRAASAELWPIPRAAWHRPLGDHPPGATGLHPPSEGEPVQSRTKRGVPVGGIGTGSFMYNLAGSFGPWEFDIGGDDSTGADWRTELNRGHEERFLSQGAFHVYQATSSGQIVKTLATEDVLPAWPRLDVGEGTYHALFPKAWVEYEGFPAPVALKQFSPFIAGDYRSSSLPVGLFQFAASNPSAEKIDLAVMFTFPNAIYRRPTTDYRYPREGLSSFVATAGPMTGVRLQAESPANVPETDRTEWVIAARDPGGARVSYTEDWAADRDGSDVFSDFAADGMLSDAPLDPRREGRAGAVAVKLSLQPGERTVIPFALAWDFPIVQFRNPVNGTMWAKRYTEWFPGGLRAWDIAAEALESADGWEAGIDSWWSKVASEPAYPVWLRRAALNELYYDVFGGVFWENGALSKPKVFGARSGQHLYFTHEANVYQDAESFDVRHYETRHLLELFPEIERDVLLAWSDFIDDHPEGVTPHDAGSPSNDPYFVYGQYFRTGRGEPPAQPDWADLPARFVQQAHAYWKQTADLAFLRDVYPSARATLEHLRRKDTDRDGLPDEGGTTFDGLSLAGESTLVAGLYIGALEAMADMARALDHGDDAARYSRLAQRARARAERSLWLERPGHYRLQSEGAGSRALMTDALNGQRYAEVNGLPPVLRRSRMAAHLRNVYERAVLPFRRGRIGAVNVIAPSGSPARARQAREVWTGVTYFTAATMYRAGEAINDPALRRAALRMARGVYRQTYVNDETAYWFDTPEAWSYDDPRRFRAQQYQRPRAVWELLLEIKDPF